MPELKLIPLADVLSDDEINALSAQLAEVGAELPEEDDDYDELEDALGDDQLTDFLDKLDAHEIACDTYLPAEFEGQLTVADRTFGSAHMLVEALEEIREELDIDAEDPLDDEDELDLSAIEEQLSHAWNVFARGANACIARSIPLLVIE
ncbi:MAG: hypothetical protein CSA65_09145 [Proteobacteria bacterium]|nr:MAG: hypothetical protein CSA65_09145 [Pseudomonadota bacterium]